MGLEQIGRAGRRAEWLTVPVSKTGNPTGGRQDPGALRAGCTAAPLGTVARAQPKISPPEPRMSARHHRKLRSRTRSRRRRRRCAPCAADGRGGADRAAAAMRHPVSGTSWCPAPMESSLMSSRPQTGQPRTAASGRMQTIGATPRPASRRCHAGVCHTAGRCGMVRPRTTAGRAMKSASTRRTWAKSAKPTRSPAP